MEVSQGLQIGLRVSQPIHKNLLPRNIISKEAIIMTSKTTSLVVTGLGTAVTAVGCLKKGTIGAGIAGFGLAHIVLGILDMFRPSVQA